MAKVIAEIDLISSFALISIDNNYTKPRILENGVLNIVNGRHAVVEHRSKSPFVPNDY